MFDFSGMNFPVCRQNDTDIRRAVVHRLRHEQVQQYARTMRSKGIFSTSSCSSCSTTSAKLMRYSCNQRMQHGHRHVRTPCHFLPGPRQLEGSSQDLALIAAHTCHIDHRGRRMPPSTRVCCCGAPCRSSCCVLVARRRQLTTSL